MTVLVIAEHDNVSLHVATRHAVGAARLCGGDVHLLVAGHDCATAARTAGRIAGVAKVWLASAPQLAHGLAENVAAQALELLAQEAYTHVLAAASTFGKSVMPRIAAGLDAGQISDVTRVVAPDIFERPIHAGNAIATVQALDAIKVLTVRPTSFNAAPLDDTEAIVQDMTPVDDAGTARVVAVERTVSARAELTSARVVVAGGRGLGSGAGFTVLEPLADALGAAIGASRAAVDAGFASNTLQIGQTGKVVAPALYVAVGISGAIQHLAGIGDAKVIVAINKDAEAPIFGVADYGIVADLFDVVPALVTALQEDEQKQLAA
ncbi:electron transfer flavoprotein subunit alpha/FixB family protein [Telluria mixta]|uniref:Electron transfer flavoprotein subunit alpha/FixB family protein n=1 Tax=Telluria mixta TaxID=34071 RepID=A0ABT2BUG5_9BURK|nr:electron transfer flavoprotein subunit alpha/FixB family protein [Telluria mixta]MCS0628770.1 electron transfer flavoprotein subunit alpha/FixB family protein [Telluria mixta]WEM97225.1 electron transfer flavoprotein subunit alpha/FixB family protein [Telluria mixta]